MINIKGLDKAEVLANLYNASNERKSIKPIITTLEVNNLMQTTMTFDYVYGVTIKMNMLLDEYNNFYYDSVNGVDSALEVIDRLKYNNYENSTGSKKDCEKEELLTMKSSLNNINSSYHMSYGFK